MADTDNTDDTHLAPNSFEVFPLSGSDTIFGWLIRRHGKAFQRSDRPSFSAEAAREKALDRIEHLRVRPD